jgi:hypothetical protein
MSKMPSNQPGNKPVPFYQRAKLGETDRRNGTCPKGRNIRHLDGGVPFRTVQASFHHTQFV